MLFDPGPRQTGGTEPAAAPLPPELLDMASSSRYITGILKALAHPARLIIMRRMVAGAASTAELAPLLDVSPSSLSKQLGRLRDGGLVDFERDNPDGRIVTVRLRDDRIAGLIGYLFGDTAC